MATQIQLTPHAEIDVVGTEGQVLSVDVDYEADGADGADYLTVEYPFPGHLPTLAYLKLHGYAVEVTV